MTFREKILVEALIFASPDPAPPRQIAKVAGLEPERIKAIVEELNQEYRHWGKPYLIREVAGGYAFHLSPDYSHFVEEFLGKKNTPRLTRSMFEVLAIVAIKQPVIKPVVDKVRGVDSSAPLAKLLDIGLVTIVGRQKSPGKPFLYGTTQKFLELFGLNSKDDIPSFEELEKIFGATEYER